MANRKDSEYILKVIQVGNSIGIILPKKDFNFRDLTPYQDWVKVEFKGVLR